MGGIKIEKTIKNYSYKTSPTGIMAELNENKNANGGATCIIGQIINRQDDLNIGNLM